MEAARKSGSLKSLRALILLDMIGDRNLTIRRESNSTPLADRHRLGRGAASSATAQFMDEETTVEDDHMPFLKAGVPSVDIIDLDYPRGTPRRTRSTTSPRAACRSSVMWWSRRCRKSKRAC